VRRFNRLLFRPDILFNLSRVISHPVLLNSSARQAGVKKKKLHGMDSILQPVQVLVVRMRSWIMKMLAHTTSMNHRLTAKTQSARRKIKYNSNSNSNEEDTHKQPSHRLTLTLTLQQPSPQTSSIVSYLISISRQLRLQ
jgi:cell shape-determining protein MreC